MAAASPAMKRSPAEATREQRAVAAKRLKNWVPEVGPANPSHVDAFLLAKMQSQRVSLKTVLAIIQQQECSAERSSSQDTSFYLVPRSHFPNGPTTEVKMWMVTKDELDERFEVYDDGTDYDYMYVFSDACPREPLGKWANKLTFKLKMARSLRVPAAEAVAAVVDHIQEAASSSTAKAEGRAADKAASANDGGEPAPAQPPRSKKNLKRCLSTTSSDEEEKTFTEIITQCTEAAAAGRIYSTDHANCHTVHFWATSVARALPSHNGDKDSEDNSCHAAVRESFGKLLTKLLLNSES